jgi:ferredoxin
MQGVVMRRATITLDPIACDGRGLCAEVLPELISLDDWGFPVIRPGGVPGELLAEAGEAVRICPKLALRLTVSEVATGAGRWLDERP